MPLQQINVSPIDKNKGNELSAPEPQMYIRSSKSQDSYGRSESQSSSQTSTSVEICRICHCEGDAEGGLIAPCYCSGSLRYVHQTCLQQWIKSSNIRCCELCKFQFIMHTKTKPFLEWEPLEMTGFERRKLLCAVIFHAIALTCVVWSLYVLIHRTAEEIQQGLLEWPFWTKLIVVAIGFTGGVVFMYIQCKAYMQICQRWKAFNRVIYVQNAPEKQPLSQQPMGGGGSSETSTSGGGARTIVGGPEVPNVGPPSNNYKDETSIDLKGVRNLHIFFNEESRVCVQNEDGESEESGEGAGADTSQWRIKIGKATGEATSHLQRCSEGCGGEGTRIGDPGEKEEGGLVGEKTTASNNDPVVKLQIKKSEIVIQFGGEKSSGGGGSSTGGGMGGGGEESLVKKDDTSVNIKIDDKDRRGEPIVIDLVKKKPSTETAAQIRFDFSKDEEGGGCPEDRLWSGSHLLPAPAYSESESDPGSHSPLLAPTVSEPN